MSYRIHDFINVLRGLELIGRSTAQVSKKRVNHKLKNTSLKILSNDLNNYADLLIRQRPSVTSQFVMDRLKLLQDQAVVIGRNTLPSFGGRSFTSDDIPKSKQNSDSDDLLSQLEDMYGLSDEPFQEDIHSDQDIIKMQLDHRAKMSKHFEPKKLLDVSQIKPLIDETKTSGKERSVPASRLARVASFGNLAVGLGFGAAAEVARRSLGIEDQQTSNSTGSLLDGNPFLNEANSQRIVDTLCRVRGAALKLGQMLSIQDNSMINPQVRKIFERVRQSADFMPKRQMNNVLNKELGENWRSNFLHFEDHPFASASIGQVHKGTLIDGREVAIKIQYPGVAQSIDSDIHNILTVLKFWNIVPEGLFVDQAIACARKELMNECDYQREADYNEYFRDKLKEDPVYHVPEVIRDLTTKQVLTTEFIKGITLDKCHTLDQDMRNWLGEQILRLCLTELFIFRHMQTDPNWSNFIYEPDSGKIGLIDFGASREFSKQFVDDYLRVIHAASIGDKHTILKYSIKLGFLTGYESKKMQNAHIDAVSILGEAFSSSHPFDFGHQSTTNRIQKLIPVMLEHRLSPPPEETYSLHRKMAGSFLLCTHTKSIVNCRSLFLEIVDNHQYGC